MALKGYSPFLKAPALDCLESYPGHLIGVGLPLCREAVGELNSPKIKRGILPTCHCRSTTVWLQYFFEKWDWNYTSMLRVVSNASWKQHPSKQQPYGHLSLISLSIQVRHAGHYRRSKDELTTDVLQWTLTQRSSLGVTVIAVGNGIKFKSWTRRCFTSC